jgi:cell division transport system permease protein
VRWNFIFTEMWQGLRRNLTMTVATILTITIALFGLGAAWLFHEQINRTHDFWFGKIEISVFLKKTVTEGQRSAIQLELKSLPQVKQIFYENQHDAFIRFKEEFASVPALVNNTTESQLPESYRVKLKNPKQFSVVASAVQNLPGVDQVAAESPALKRIFQFFDTLQRFVLFIALGVLLAALLLIFNNVRLAAFSRRREVGIMRLVGASDAYIQAPFVLEIVVGALVGSAIATGLLFVVKAVIFDQGIAKAFSSNLLDIISYGTVVAAIPFIVLTGLAISVITAVGTLQRYLRV